jgi:hypothetical protein
LDTSASRNSPRRLPTFVYNGKAWTVDVRLGEFRHIVFGEVTEFVPFDSRLGVELKDYWSNLEQVRND